MYNRPYSVNMLWMWRRVCVYIYIYMIYYTLLYHIMLWLCLSSLLLLYTQCLFTRVVMPASLFLRSSRGGACAEPHGYSLQGGAVGGGCSGLGQYHMINQYTTWYKSLHPVSTAPPFDESWPQPASRPGAAARRRGRPPARPPAQIIIINKIIMIVIVIVILIIAITINMKSIITIVVIVVIQPAGSASLPTTPPTRPPARPPVRPPAPGAIRVIISLVTVSVIIFIVCTALRCYSILYHIIWCLSIIVYLLSIDLSIFTIYLSIVTLIVYLLFNHIISSGPPIHTYTTGGCMFMYMHIPNT